MIFTSQEIAEIIAETVEETVKDLESVSTSIALIADVSLQVYQTLLAEPSLVENPTRSRSLRSGMLAAEAIRRVKDRYESPPQP